MTFIRCTFVAICTSALCACAAMASVPPVPPAKPVLCQDVPFQSGLASVYGSKFQGRRTASGEALALHDLTAAHPSLAFGTHVEVRDRKTGRRVTVRINDRGPFVRGRVIDLTPIGREKLGRGADGIYPVTLHLCR